MFFPRNILNFYQTSHLLTGFIRLPSEHWKSLANSGRLLIGPITLNRAGGCGSTLICLTKVSEMKLNRNLKWKTLKLNYICVSCSRWTTQKVYPFGNCCTNSEQLQSRRVDVLYNLSQEVLVQVHFLVPNCDMPDKLLWDPHCQLCFHLAKCNRSTTSIFK